MKGIARALLEKIALAGVSLVLLAAVEGGLRLAGVGSPSFGALDFGIPVNDDVFVPDPGSPGTMVVAPWLFEMSRGAHRKLINVDTFPRHRPRGEIRIVAVGESAVFGYPDGGPMAFPYQLGELVKARHGLPVDVINAGIPGYDARRTARVLEEVLRYEPSVVVMYTGHNEYLRRFTMENLERLGWQVRLRQSLSRLRLYQLLSRALRPVIARSGRTGVDVSSLTREMEKREGFAAPRTPLETRLVEERYRHHLERAVDSARRAKVPLLLCTVVSNPKAYPKHTVYDAGVGQADMERAEALRWKLRDLFQKGDHVAAEAAAREALAIVPGHAQFHHFLAQALEGQGKLAEALPEYVQARDLEATQRRGGVAFANAVRQIGTAGGAVVVDLEKVFLADMAHGHWGETLFSDYCHPTAEGHAIIAEELYRALDWTRLPR